MPNIITNPRLYIKNIIKHPLSLVSLRVFKYYCMVEFAYRILFYCWAVGG